MKAVDVLIKSVGVLRELPLPILHQPEDQRLRACLRTAPGRRMSDSVVVVEVGTRGRAGRVHTATRCFT